MGLALGTFAIAAIQDALFSGAALGAPATWTIRAYTVAPNTAGAGGTEATYTGYVALSQANDAAHWNASVGLHKTNKTSVTFGHNVGVASQNIVAIAFLDGSANLWILCTFSALTVPYLGAPEFLPGTIDWAMGAQLTDFAIPLIQNAVLGASALGAPATWYGELFSISPTTTDRTTGTESAYTSYARVPVTNNVTNFSASSAGHKKNAAAQFWPCNTGSNENRRAIGWNDAATAGNLWIYGAVSDVVAKGQTPKLAINDLDWSLV